MFAGDVHLNPAIYITISCVLLIGLVGCIYGYRRGRLKAREAARAARERQQQQPPQRQQGGGIASKEEASSSTVLPVLVINPDQDMQCGMMLEGVEAEAQAAQSRAHRGSAGSSSEVPGWVAEALVESEEPGHAVLPRNPAAQAVLASEEAGPEPAVNR